MHIGTTIEISEIWTSAGGAYSRRPRLYHALVPGTATTRDPRGAVHSTAVVAASLAAWSVGVYFFYLLAGRLLGPEEYGLAAALQAVVVVVSLPLAALQWSAARTVASAPDDPQVGAVYRHALTVVTATAAGLAAVATLVTAITASQLSLPTGALIATYWSLVPLAPLLLAMGTMQGFHRYGGFAWSFGLTGVLRAPLLLVFLALPWITQVEATMVATGVPLAIGALLGIWLTRALLRGTPRPGRAALKAFWAGMAPTVVGLAGIAVLINVDVIAAKLNIGGEEAGYFGAASIIAKSLMLVPQALITVLLPRVAERRARDEATGSLLAIGVLLIFAAGIVAVVLSIPLEGPITTITFGDAYEPAAQLVLPFFAATTLLGALLILVNHHVARGDNRFSWVVGALAIIQLALLATVGTTAGRIIAIDAVVAAVGLVAHEILYFRTGDSMLRGAAGQARTLMARIRSARRADA